MGNISDFIKRKQIQIVNLSFYTFSNKEDCKRRFKFIFDNPNTLFILGAGNDGLRNPYLCPQSIVTELPNIIVVSGSKNARLHSSSNYGSNYADVAAPYETIEFGTGTSISSPMVANVAAKIFSLDPMLTPSTVKEIILKTVMVDFNYPLEVRSKGVLSSKNALIVAETLIQRRKADPTVTVEIIIKELELLEEI